MKHQVTSEQLDKWEYLGADYLYFDCPQGCALVRWSGQHYPDIGVIIGRPEYAEIICEALNEHKKKYPAKFAGL